MITQSRLKELMHYCPGSGKFTRLSCPISRVGNKSVINGKPYLVIGIAGYSLLAHRLAWLYMSGSFPPDEIDHIDGNGMNNKLSNLRAVSKAENRRNKRRYSSNTSGYNGIFWCKHAKKWIARIRVCGDRINLGSYGSLLDAVAARIRADKQYGFHKNHGQTRPL